MPHIPPADVAIHQVRSRDKPRKCYDRRGLYREIAPHCTKAWRFKYRFADKEKRNSLGIDPEGALELARERCDETRELLARYGDPSAYDQAQKKAKRQWTRNSFEAVARQWPAKQLPNWTTRQAGRVRGQLERDVVPWVKPSRRTHEGATAQERAGPPGACPPDGLGVRLLARGRWCPRASNPTRETASSGCERRRLRRPVGQV